MPIVDGSSIKDFDPVPEGIYDCRLEKFDNKTAKSDGSPNVNLSFTIEEDGEFQGRKFFFTHNLKPQSLWSFKKTCVALGADPEEFVGQFDTDDILTKLIGNECRIHAGIQAEGEYAGRQEILEILAMGMSLV